MPSSPHDVAAVATHWLAGEGAVPLATLLHSAEAAGDRARLARPVSHAWLQQYPCAQKPEPHSPAIVHAAPVGLSVQMLALQMFGATQSVAAVVQLVRQAPAVVSQVYLPHGLDVAAPQTPAPLQVRADSAIVALDAHRRRALGAADVLAARAGAVTGAVVAARRRRGRRALRGHQRWSARRDRRARPDAARERARHAGARAGGVAADVADAEPGLAVRVHARSGRHRRSGSCRSCCSRRCCRVVQSAAVVVQVVLQPPVPQVYGVHGLVVAARQTPAPSQDRGDDSVEPVQLAAPQAVRPRSCGTRRRRCTYRRCHTSVAAHVGALRGGRGAVPAGIGEHVPTRPGEVARLAGGGAAGVAADPLLAVARLAHPPPTCTACRSPAACRRCRCS